MNFSNSENTGVGQYSFYLQQHKRRHQMRLLTSSTSPIVTLNLGHAVQRKPLHGHNAYSLMSTDCLWCRVSFTGNSRPTYYLCVYVSTLGCSEV